MAGLIHLIRRHDSRIVTVAPRPDDARCAKIMTLPQPARQGLKIVGKPPDEGEELTPSAATPPEAPSKG